MIYINTTKYYLISKRLVGWSIVEFKADFLTGDLGLGGWVASVGVFLKDPNPYFREVRRKPQKTPNDEVDKHEEDSTWHFPSTNFERRTAQSVVGTRTGSLTSMPYPGIEPGTFSAAAGTPSH